MNGLNKKYSGFKVKSGAAWKDYKAARLQISVGQIYHEGKAFEETAAWIRQNFKDTIICVNDTLQRYNFEFEGMDREKAFQKSEENGREWIERNYPVLKTLPNVKIYRWNNWIKNPSYKSKQNFIDALYQSSSAYRKMIDKEIDMFWIRKQKRENLPDAQFYNFRKHSMAYLKEECAAFMLMFEQTKAADIYPGSSLLPCAVFRSGEGFGVKGFTRIEVSQ